MWVNKWEYTNIYLNWGTIGIDIENNIIVAAKLIDQLNVFGQSGWELVSLRVNSGQNNGTATFKREIE